MPKQTRIILFRHGETDWNKQQRWQGHSDIPLNATGEKQAEALAKILETEEIASIFSSDLIRAHKTAEALSARIGCQIHTDQRLRELFVGDAEGKFLKETDDLFGQGTLATFFANTNGDFKFPNGETKDEHHKRLLEFLLEMAPRFLGKTIAISTHGGSLHRLFCSAWHDLSHKVHLPNCAQMVLAVDTNLKISFADKTKPPFRNLE